MSKLFWEAIPGLQVNDEQRALFDRVEIEKVVSTRDRSAIKIYIHSERLIHKRNVLQMEAEIKKQLFPAADTRVSIVEKYSLSAQYTPENLMRAYEDSILYELKPYSLVLYNLMKKSRWEFTDAHVCLMHLDDALVARSKAGELKRILEKIFMERCGTDLDVRFQYEAVESHKDNSVEERRQAEEILRRAGKTIGEDGMMVLNESSGADAQSGVKSETGANASAKEKAAGGTGKTAAGQSSKAANANGQSSGQGSKFGGKDSFGNRKSAFKKKPKNDDVLFGYDFDDHSTAISDITPEMGAVVINGQVIALEARELRSGKTILV
ncbi:MAG: PolC-type DNA polymerase III, partial [Lachnospiraceae bacterium]|nr:PolC-type DNA polymerase III [Lachnospiraceae bacterium]